MADINIGQITEALNNKLDRDGMNAGNPASVVVETYQNGSSWYRVYSDGWCEQGGLTATETANATISLLKPYVDTNYTVSVNAYKASAGSSGGTEYGMTVGNFTVNSFYAVIQSGVRQYIWQTCGYIN